MARRIAILALVVLASACADSSRERHGPAGPDFARGELPHDPGPGDAASDPLLLMTRNLYFGTDVFQVAGVPPEQIPLAVGSAWQEVVASDVPARMAALAAEIAAEMPHAVGLQEVARFAVIDPGTGHAVAGYDFLSLLLAALAARGADYQVAVANQNLLIQLPAVLPGGFRIITLVDRDVILARGDVQVAATERGQYARFLPFPVGGTVVPVTRGWTLARLAAAGRPFTFVNTHLEVERFAAVQEAQAAELASLLEPEEGVVVLTGDFNSDAHDGAFSDGASDSDSYEILLAAGFTDLWDARGQAGPGLTCCHAPDLRNAEPRLYSRIDLVLARSPSPAAAAPFAGAVHLGVTGDEWADRIAGLLWPSDHAGVVASLRLPRTAFAAPPRGSGSSGSSGRGR